MSDPAREEDRRKLLAFLETIQRPDRPLADVGERDSLVEAGLIDSLALLEIVAFLEAEYGVDFREEGVDPETLSSISGILSLIGR